MRYTMMMIQSETYDQAVGRQLGDKLNGWQNTGETYQFEEAFYREFEFDAGSDTATAVVADPIAQRLAVFAAMLTGRPVTLEREHLPSDAHPSMGSNRAYRGCWSRYALEPETGVGMVEWCIDPRDGATLLWVAHPDGRITTVAGLQEVATSPEPTPWRDAKSGEVWVFKGKHQEAPMAFMFTGNGARRYGWVNPTGAILADTYTKTQPYGTDHDPDFTPYRVWPVAKTQ